MNRPAGWNEAITFSENLRDVLNNHKTRLFVESHVYNFLV
jgi:hypothetical protein